METFFVLLMCLYVGLFVYVMNRDEFFAEYRCRKLIGKIFITEGKTYDPYTKQYTTKITEYKKVIDVKDGIAYVELDPNYNNAVKYDPSTLLLCLRHYKMKELNLDDLVSELVI